MSVWSGASDQIRQLNRTVKPIVEYSRDGDEYVAKASAAGKEHTHKFRLNVELDETTLDGRQVKVSTTFLLPTWVINEQLLVNFQYQQQLWTRLWMNWNCFVSELLQTRW